MSKLTPEALRALHYFDLGRCFSGTDEGHWKGFGVWEHGKPYRPTDKMFRQLVRLGLLRELPCDWPDHAYYDLTNEAYEALRDSVYGEVPHIRGNNNGP